MRKWASSHQIKPFVVTSNVTEGSEVFFIFFFSPKRFTACLVPFLLVGKHLLGLRKHKEALTCEEQLLYTLELMNTWLYMILSTDANMAQ